MFLDIDPFISSAIQSFIFCCGFDKMCCTNKLHGHIWLCRFPKCQGGGKFDAF